MQMLHDIREFIESQAGTMLFLFFGLLLFSALCVFVALKVPSNDKIYALLAGCAGTFNGGLLMFIKMKSGDPGK
jgi:hypothetical protein